MLPLPWGLQKRTANPCGLHFHADEDPRRVLGGSQSAESDRAKRASATDGARGRVTHFAIRVGAVASAARQKSVM